MSTSEFDNDDAEIRSDHEKAEVRRNRRPSVQFIDKNLIRRRSGGLEKQQTITQPQQPTRLASIDSHGEVEAAEVEEHKHDCED